MEPWIELLNTISATDAAGVKKPKTYGLRKPGFNMPNGSKKGI